MKHVVASEFAFTEQQEQALIDAVCDMIIGNLLFKPVMLPAVVCISDTWPTCGASPLSNTGCISASREKNGHAGLGVVNEARTYYLELARKQKAQLERKLGTQSHQAAFPFLFQPCRSILGSVKHLPGTQATRNDLISRTCMTLSDVRSNYHR